MSIWGNVIATPQRRLVLMGVVMAVALGGCTVAEVVSDRGLDTRIERLRAEVVPRVRAARPERVLIGPAAEAEVGPYVSISSNAPGSFTVKYEVSNWLGARCLVVRRSADGRVASTVESSGCF